MSNKSKSVDNAEQVEQVEETPDLRERVATQIAAHESDMKDIELEARRLRGQSQALLHKADEYDVELSIRAAIIEELKRLVA